MTEADDRYPDNSGIHARKARGRRERSKLSFAEKIEALDALRDRVEPIIRARRSRQQEKQAHSPKRS